MLLTKRGGKSGVKITYYENNKNSSNNNRWKVVTKRPARQRLRAKQIARTAARLARKKKTQERTKEKRRLASIWKQVRERRNQEIAMERYLINQASSRANQILNNAKRNTEPQKVRTQKFFLPYRLKKMAEQAERDRLKRERRTVLQRLQERRKRHKEGLKA